MYFTRSKSRVIFIKFICILGAEKIKLLIAFAVHSFKTSINFPGFFLFSKNAFFHRILLVIIKFKNKVLIILFCRCIYEFIGNSRANLLVSKSMNLISCPAKINFSSLTVTLV